MSYRTDRLRLPFSGLNALLGSLAVAALPATTIAADRSATVSTPGGKVTVTPITNSIFKVTHLPARHRLEFVPSKAVVLDTCPNQANTSVFPGYAEIVSPDAKVRIDRATGRVSFLTPDGELLIEEAPGWDLLSEHEKTLRFANAAPQNFYGAGERGHRSILNGDTLSMYNRQNYGYTSGDPRLSQMGISVPYVASDHGYSILFDDYAKADLHLGEDTITYRSETPLGISYYVMVGEGDSSLASLTTDMTRLTGRQGLPPFWTLGYVTSKYGYHDRAETEGVVDTLLNRGYPLDGLVLDLYWYGVEQDMGRLEWDSVKWPAHAEMLQGLRERGVNTVLISQPYVNKGGAIDNYNMFAELGMLVKDADGEVKDVTTWVGDAGMLDMANPATRRWLWERLRPLTAEGVAGWWGDLGDLEVHPLGMVHANGQTTEEYHNAYGNDWSQTIYEGLRRDFPDRRPMLMMRGGTTGLQRYNVFPWTTDVSRSWGGLQPQINLMLSSGLSGLGYMGSDIGGFAVDPAHPTDPELYARWIQLGAFSPMLRTHAQLKPEPYNYPEVESVSKKYIRMRYQWLPYNYTLAYENAAFGYPLARPLNFFGDNPGSEYAGVDDEYMWGDNVLVAPVMKKGARSRRVLFPAGRWVDFDNPKLIYKGGTAATVKAPLDKLPLFVREGSFIPLYPDEIGNVTQYDLSHLTVRYFPSCSQTAYTLFDDDRMSPTSLADGQYQLTTFTGQKDAGGVWISLQSSGGIYPGMPSSRWITLEVTGMGSRPKSVTVNGRTLPVLKGSDTEGWTYDSRQATVSLRLNWDYAETEVHVKL